MKISTLLLTVISLISCSDHGLAQPRPDYQSKAFPDSSFYWININYLKYLDSEVSVCDCLSQNEIVMFFLDIDKSEALIQSSIFHFGLEQSDKYELIKKTNDPKLYAINSWRKDSISILFENYNNALVTYKGHTQYFKKEIFKTLKIPKTPKGIFVQYLDMAEQLGAINSRSLLNYIPSSLSDSTNINIPYEHLIKMIKENKVFIYCSDDLYYNEMVIKEDPYRFFYLKYEDNRLTVYDEILGRDRDEEIDLNKLKYQTFIRKK